MEGTEINTIRKSNNDVFIKVDDLIKTFYRDFGNLENNEVAVKKYIKACVENWEDFQKTIRDKNL